LLNEPAIAYNRHYTPEEYLNMEWENGQRYEYWDGNLLAMAGASMNHAKITLNLIFGFGPYIRKKDADL
jgi:Uma2 family endonuclease